MISRVGVCPIILGVLLVAVIIIVIALAIGRAQEHVCECEHERPARGPTSPAASHRPAPASSSFISLALI